MSLSINTAVDALNIYVDQNRDSLISGAVAGAKSAELLNLQVGYKSSGSINIMDTDVVFQADAAGRTPSGTTSLTQRVLTVGAIKIEEDIDVKALNAIYMQHALKAGSKDDVVPFEQAWTALKVAKVASVLETAIWQGDTGSGNANLNQFDGFIKIVDAEAAIDGNVGGVTAITGVTAANVIAILDGMYQSIPLSVLESGDVKIMVGFDMYRLYTQALKDANLYHYSADSSNFSIALAGTDVEIVALQGLSTTDRIFAGKPENFVIGTDLANEEEEFDVWYSKEDKIVKLDMAFKYGCQVAFPTEIVEFTLVP